MKLSVDRIHYLIDQQVNGGAFKYRGYNDVQKDELINNEVFSILQRISEKKKVDEIKGIDSITDAEKLLLLELHKTYSSGINSFILPTDYNGAINAKVLTYYSSSGCMADSIKKDELYLSLLPTKYEGTWYEVGQSFIGNNEKSFYGSVKEVRGIVQPAIYVDNTVIHTFPNSNTVYYTIEGKELVLRTKLNLALFTLNYKGNFDTQRINSCNNKTLDFSESVQRYIIEQVCLRMLIINEESQQKIENFK